ncbi:hypothetical protein JCM16161A_23010 [Vulcanisaeta sp. JCM 16161]|uniref:hypothetical protein n=1 Tax=Vulcanisaeta sp. JCM 16161 TaxID=1295372 RepID=UPI00406C6E1F
MGVTGNELDINNFCGVSNIPVIQCAARLEVKYLRVDERFLAKNARGWVGVVTGDGVELHGAPAAWALPDDPVSTDFVGRESLVLFRLVPAWGSLGSVDPRVVCQNVEHYVNQEYILVFPPGNKMCARYNTNKCSLSCKTEVCGDNTLVFRAAAENVHGVSCRVRLADAIRACLESYCRGKVPTKVHCEVRAR